MTAKAGVFRFLPYAVMGLVVLMYVVKVYLKLWIGNMINSPMIMGDGFHNAADIFEAILVITVIAIANRPPNWKYPFGRKNIESIFELAIGVSLFFMALRILGASLRGILVYFPSFNAGIPAWLPLPRHESLLMGPEYFWYVFGTVAISAIVSFVVSGIQVATGKKTGHESLVADGVETRNDGFIESMAALGVLGEYGFNASWLEYPFGLAIAILLFRAGAGLVVRGWRTLLQRSIGKEHEKEIFELTKATYGVIDIPEIKTFKVGSMPILIMKVITACSAEGDLDIKYALAHRIGLYMTAQGFSQWEYYIRFDKLNPDRHRVVFAVIKHGEFVVVSPNMAKATHFRVCDVEAGEIIRWKDYVKPVSPIESINLIKKRETREFRSFDEDRVVISELAGLGIKYVRAPTISLRSFGI